ncbi:SdiA-regulated domain-containing protein [Pseudomonas xionganensis]|uniref:DNA-binding protein n=1 Tax=Pseudomonas xionganensis TaxID=2654845 RepID=A0A6I4KQG1_9PSED|nr:SdiA-regulated domain-containing protein [Pseudomonas xionganensis]MVW74277.1 DNA-binding protein [Pseudomonas xionganensis]
MIVVITFKRILFCALLMALLLVGLFAQQHRLFERAWYAALELYELRWGDKPSMRLNDYRVVIEAKQVEGLEELSALTYDPDRNSLFSVVRGPTRIIELSLEGELLREVALRGVSDPEAIEYVQRDTYVVADEQDQRLIKVVLSEGVDSVDVAGFQQLSLGIGLNGNKGFEGLAWDSERQRLLVAKERDPVRIFEIVGFPHVDAHKPLDLQVNIDTKRDARLFVRDLSSLDYDTSTGHLLALSHESYMVLEVDSKGKPVSRLSLLKGMQGLSKRVPQAEGVASDNAGNLYLISEPNLFYVFRKPAD